METPTVTCGCVLRMGLTAMYFQACAISDNTTLEPREQAIIPSSVSEWLEQYTPLPLVLCAMIDEYFHSVCVTMAHTVYLYSPWNQLAPRPTTEDSARFQCEHKDLSQPHAFLVPCAAPLLTSAMDRHDPDGFEIGGQEWRITAGRGPRYPHELRQRVYFWESVDPLYTARTSSDSHGHVVFYANTTDELLLIYDSGMIEIVGPDGSVWMDLNVLPGLGLKTHKLLIRDAKRIAPGTWNLAGTANSPNAKGLWVVQHSLYFTLSLRCRHEDRGKYQPKMKIMGKETI